MGFVKFGCFSPVIWIGSLFLNNCQIYFGAAFQRVVKLGVLLKYLVKTEGQNDVTIPRRNSSENHIYRLEISICTSYLRLLPWPLGEIDTSSVLFILPKGTHAQFAKLILTQSTHFLSIDKSS